MADFQSSTHRARWIFTPEELAGKYKAANQGAMQALEKVPDSRPKPISIEEEQFMRVFYENKLQEVCTNFHFPHKVQPIPIQNPLALKRSNLCEYFMRTNFKKIVPTFTFRIKFRYAVSPVDRRKNSNGSHIFQEVLSTVVGDATSSKNYNNFVINHETYPLNLMQQVCRVADFERYLSSILCRQSSAHTISELVEFLNAIDSWAKRYEFPSDKDLKHINRKLKSCWGLSTHDESKKRDKKSKHKSKRSSNEAQT
ncbi:hypothetical protein C1H46_009269 [Malus baccata]|uniref:Uncharacterized protein n=1 Tax=Malus baccata TaxID=106549 RepID=A0A540N226_MALBA|nr:hypothetical protein C1H46_009269 [Malus baccata]